MFQNDVFVAVASDCLSSILRWRNESLITLLRIELSHIGFAQNRLFITIIPYFSAADGKTSDCLFVSHQTGEDTSVCGSSVQPCQTLPQALLLVSDGGKICLDGRNSESHPYSCLPLNSLPKVKMNLVNKSITIQGWFANAHISCKRPYYLDFKHRRNRTLTLALSHLVFHNGGLILSNTSCSNIVITNCRFVNCRKAVVVAQAESRACRNSSLLITDTEFLYNRISVYAYLLDKFFSLRISRCIFQGKERRFKVTSDEGNTTGAVHIMSKTLGNRIHVFGFITNSIFRELAHDYNGFALLFKIENLYSTGCLKLLNSTFFGNENAVYVYGGFDVRFSGVTINSTYGYAIKASGPPKVQAIVVGLKMSLDHCTLGNNRVGIRMAMVPCVPTTVPSCSPSSQELLVKNTLFLGGNMTRGTGDAITFTAMNDFDVPRPAFIEAAVFLENVTFQGLLDRALYVAVQKNVSGFISLKNCKFLDNSVIVSQINERSIVQIEFKEEDPPKCFKQEWEKGKKLAQSKETQIPVIFEDIIFQKNVGISAALTFLNGNITFKNCIFKNNEGLTLGGHVYIEPGYGRLNIINSNFLQTVSNDAISNSKQRRISSEGCFLHSESVGPIIITNTSFTANINRRFSPIVAATMTSLFNVDATSIFRCPSGRHVKQERKETTEGFAFNSAEEACWMKVNYVKLFCDECPDEFYSLQRGLATGLDMNKASENTICLKCPFGASCENGNVKAKENFWGLNISTNPPSANFFRCPSEYCRSPSHSKHFAYNDCHGRRSGVLCGNCTNGFSEALYSTSCRKKENCNDHWFWLATAIYVGLFAIYLVFKATIMSVLYRQTLWFRKSQQSFYARSLPREAGDKHDSGYLKIVFYFYQVVKLVMIKSPEKAFQMVPFIPPIIAIFNFQVKTLDGSIGCPLPGLSVVTKQLFLSSTFLATFLTIGVIYAFHRAASKSRYILQPSMTLYLAAALQTLLLGYERLADTTLKLVHCVPVGKDWRLFVDGNVQCWQWWQYLLIAFIVVFIIPLILVLFWGSLMVAKDKVSGKEFSIACALPLPCLLVWINRHFKKTEDNSMRLRSNLQEAEEIQKVLFDPFREPSKDNHGTLYWESVLTSRRLILLTIHTFATNPIVRFICLNGACVVILVFHLALRPFRDRIANFFESLSLMSLVTICTFSLAEAAYFYEGTVPTGPSQTLFNALQWIEIGLLGLVPAAVCILIVFAALSQVFRLLYHFIRLLAYVMRSICFFPDLWPGRLSMSQQLLLNGDFEELKSVA